MRHDEPESNGAEARRMAQLHAFSSSVSAAMLRLSDPRDLCETACRLAVERGLATLAWVGVVSGEAITPLARFGRDEAYVDMLRLHPDGDAAGLGPAARAIRSGAVVAVGDIARDEGFHWREEALARGFRACAVFPLPLGRGSGVLVLYADVPDAYRREDIEVLTALSENLRFAIASSTIAAERSKLLDDLGERVKELTLLHRAARLLQGERPVDESLLRELLELIPGAWQRPGRCRARIRWGSVDVATPGFRETRWRLVEPLRAGPAEGAIEVVYLEHSDDAPHGAELAAFLPEERELLRSLSEMLSARLAHDAAEARERSTAAMLRMAGAVARIGAWSVDVTTGRVVWSDEMCRILEVPTGSAPQGDDAFLHYAPDLRESMRRDFSACAQEGTPFDVEGQALTSTGRRVWVRVIAVAHRGPDGRVERIEGAMQDVDERRRLEEELRQAQKMEAIGRLAGGVAHDFNNLLSVILGYASFIVDGLPPGAPLRADAEQVVRAGERAADLTRHLLAFSRQQMVQPCVLDVHEVVRSLEPMLRRLLPEDASLTVGTSGEHGRTVADRGQIEQLVMNLVVNARDAMPAGGELTIETSDVVLEPAEARRNDVPPGRYVRLVVEDDGTGMDAATRARAFDPFFTTKPKGAGTGLGLATVYGIVLQSRGHIRLESEPGRGARFEIVLPSVDAPVDVVAARPHVKAGRGHETILVVEDMDEVRAVVAAVLDRAGYQVLVAGGGAEALQLCETHPGVIHLVLTDVIMPHMSGPEVVARAASRRPDMKVLYMSGHAEESIVERGAPHGDVAFIAKPITPEALVAKIRATLGAESGADSAPRPGPGASAAGATGLPSRGAR